MLGAQSNIEEVMMLSKTTISSKNEPDFICRANGDTVINKAENPINSSNIQIEEEKNWDKFRERSMSRWHPSKLEGYVSDEFRSVEFAD
jgi:hypothetical protein